jgi:hypothetical protein
VKLIFLICGWLAMACPATWPKPFIKNLEKTGNNVDDALGEAGLLEILGQIEGGERGELGGLEDDGVSLG